MFSIVFFLIICLITDILVFNFGGDNSVAAEIIFSFFFFLVLVWLLH